MHIRPLHSGRVTKHMPQNPASGQHGRKGVYPSAMIASWLRISRAPGRPKINEIMEKVLHKVELLLKHGPQDPLTCSPPEQSAGEVCLLSLGMLRQTCFMPKCWSSWSSYPKFSLCAGSVVLFCFSQSLFLWTGTSCVCSERVRPLAQRTRRI